MAVDVIEIARRMKAKKKPPGDDEEDGSPEEEASESPEEATAEGDDAGGEPDAGAEDDMGSYDKIEDSAVQDIINSKDPATVKAALKQFVKACMDRDEE